MAETFTSFEAFKAVLQAAPGPHQDVRDAAEARNMQLTKPPGALGRLEDLAFWYAGWRGQVRPTLNAPQVLIFAANHGITAQGVSAFPAEVTRQMVANFDRGGAAINQLAKAFNARMDVHAIDLDKPTQDFTKAPAMTVEECLAALQIGWDAVDPTADLLVTGEMGIGNTTSAAAMGAALFGGMADGWAGRGTGVDDDGLVNKTRVVIEGLARHSSEDPLEILRCLGGREVAAMAGAIASARLKRIPVILDGFICTAAASVLEKTVPGALDHTVAGHLSAERAHRKMLEFLNKQPLLDLDLRLGEGSGAALAIGILQGAIACHSDMATFEEAGVAER